MFDLSTLEGLKAACEEAERRPEGYVDGWRKNILDLLTYVEKASPQEREREEFHRKIWDENGISSIGSGKINVRLAITEFDVRKRVLEKLTKPLPNERRERIDFLNGIRIYLMNNVFQGMPRMPRAKINRMLASIFPTEFTTLIVDNGSYIKQILKKMGIDSRKSSHIERHRQILDRLEEALGPVPNGDLHKLVNRMTLPMMLLDLTGQEQKKTGQKGTNPSGEASPTSAEQTKGITEMRTTDTQNIILYGPPGTGKTYDTKQQALNLIDKDEFEKLMNKNGFEKLIAEQFNEYQKKGQIEFVTFHQSYGYEDFIEGLRPVLDETGEKDVHYEMHNGIFKRIALRAAAEGLSKTTEGLDFEDLWALLIEDIRTSEDIIIAQSKSKNDYVLSISGHNNIEILRCEINTEGDIQILPGARKKSVSRRNSQKIWDNFHNKPDDLTLNKVGSILGGSIDFTSAWIAYNKLFKLNKDKDTAYSPQIGNTAREEKARAALENNSSFKFPLNSQQYVLIIDEINRGNISKILGELMTLLEPDKRLGAANELRLPLAYSPQSRFGVPPNLHILGTMNTADRSIALMDVALRRRFTFKEVMPNQKVLEKKLRGDSHLVRLVVDLFEILNKRIRLLYDRDRQIGHAYFLGVESLDDLRLVFADRVIPLLQEYFYGDWNKICMILGCPYGDDRKPKRTAPYLLEEKTYRAPIIQASNFSEKDTLGFDHNDYEYRVDFSITPEFQNGGMKKDDLIRTFLGVLQIEQDDFDTRLKELMGDEASPDKEEAGGKTAGEAS